VAGVDTSGREGWAAEFIRVVGVALGASFFGFRVSRQAQDAGDADSGRTLRSAPPSPSYSSQHREANWVGWCFWVVGGMLGFGGAVLAVVTGKEPWSVAWIRIPAGFAFVIVLAAFSTWIPAATRRVVIVFAALSLAVGARFYLFIAETEESLARCLWLS